MKGISVQEYYKNKDQYVLIDVREDEELAIAKITPSIHIPLQQLPSQFASLDKTKTYVMVCHFGRRSQMAAEFLNSKGFHVMNLIGGIDRYSLEIDPTIPRY